MSRHNQKDISKPGALWSSAEELGQQVAVVDLTVCDGCVAEQGPDKLDHLAFLHLEHQFDVASRQRWSRTANFEANLAFHKHH